MVEANLAASDTGECRIDELLMLGAGRVIVVRTYDGKYAKFQVMSVIPPAP